MRNKKIIFGVSIILLVIFGMSLLMSDEDFKTASQIANADKLLEQYKNGEIEKGMALFELVDLEKSDNEEVSTYATKIMNEIEVWDDSLELLDEAWKSIRNNELNEYSKTLLVESINETISVDSELRKDAEKVLAKLSTYEQKTISVSSSSTHYESGIRKIEIKVENNMNKDIDYIKIDIFERSKDGDIISSDWANTSSIIKDSSVGYIETYYDFKEVDSKLEFEISDISYR